MPTEVRSKLVYTIPCKSFPTTYVGETTPYLKNRMSGHKSDVNQFNTNCMLANHSINEGHTFDFESTKILDTESHESKRKIKEMIHIARDPNACNKRTDIEKLGKIYSNIIK